MATLVKCVSVCVGGFLWVVAFPSKVVGGQFRPEGWHEVVDRKDRAGWWRGVGWMRRTLFFFFGALPDAEVPVWLVFPRSNPRVSFFLLVCCCCLLLLLLLLSTRGGAESGWLSPPPPSDAHRHPPGAQPARQDQPRACLPPQRMLAAPPILHGQSPFFFSLSLQASHPLCLPPTLSPYPHGHLCSTPASAHHQQSDIFSSKPQFSSFYNYAQKIMSQAVISYYVLINNECLKKCGFFF